MEANYNIVVVFVIHWHESAMDIYVFPIPIPPTTSLSTWSLWVFPVHQVRALDSCIQPGLVICFTLDNIHVLMLFSWNIPPSPSPTESKSLFCISASLFLFCISGYHYHLSKFHIYVLVYCNWSLSFWLKPTDFDKLHYHSHSAQNIWKFLLKFLLWPMYYLEVYYLISNYLRIFQLSLLFISSLIPPWSEARHCLISSLLNLLRCCGPECSPNKCSIWA